MHFKRGALCVLMLAILLCALPQSASANRFTCLFFGTGCPPGPSGVPGSGDVTAPAPPAWVPTFLTGVTINSPFGGPYAMNSDYFATPETANTLCKRLQCSFVYSRPCAEASDPFFCSQPQMWITFPDCFTVNAGVLAAYYVRNPEDQFPNVAYNAIQAVLATDRAAQKPSCAAPAKPWPATSVSLMLAALPARISGR
jgi:hypothetical protein